jgi:hypothetical protein
MSREVVKGGVNEEGNKKSKREAGSESFLPIVEVLEEL